MTNTFIFTCDTAADAQNKWEGNAPLLCRLGRGGPPMHPSLSYTPTTPEAQTGEVPCPKCWSLGGRAGMQTLRSLKHPRESDGWSLRVGKPFLASQACLFLWRGSPRLGDARVTVLTPISWSAHHSHRLG